MASIQDIGIPGIGTGIVQPILPYRFHVVFEDKDRHYPELTMQVLAVSALDTRGSVVSMRIQDDILSQAARALLTIKEKNDPSFEVRINYMDGNDCVLRTHRLGRVFVNSVVFSALDYAGGLARETMTLSIPGSHISDDEVERKQLFRLLKGASLTFDQNVCGAGTSYMDVDFTFTSFNVTFSNLSTLKE